MNTCKLSYSERHLIALWVTAIISGLMAFYLMNQMPYLFPLGGMFGLTMI